MTNGSLSEKLGRLSGQLDQLIPSLEKVWEKTDENSKEVAVLKSQREQVLVEIAATKSLLSSLREDFKVREARGAAMRNKLVDALLRYALPAAIAAASGLGAAASMAS